MHELLKFNNEKLLRLALTHRSYANENPEEKGHNERLEFLGDAILNFISGEYLYSLHPEMEEGEMTRKRSALVDEKQLARFATEVGIDFRMRLGQGVIRDGGYQNPNLLSSTFEAVVGAYYLDQNRDIKKVQDLVKKLFDSVPSDIMTVRSSVDPKNKFQELVQAKGITTPPNYVTKRIGGTDHAPKFLAKVYVNGESYGVGNGRSKKEAEKDAANDGIKNWES